jgi:bidirectional [NiFe] hydrogenase diaphorase subunit
MFIDITVDGIRQTAEEGTFLLNALQRLEIQIPALCYHPALTKPIGACRLCVVEVRDGDSPARIQRSCITRVKPGMQIITENDAIIAARGRAMNALMTYAPQSEKLFGLAEKYHLHTQPLPDGCIRCHLCYRVCEEIIGAGALRLAHREGHAYIVPIPGRCIGCGTCANVCPTNAIHVADHDNVRTITIREEIIGQHPLERCEGCGQLYATPDFLAIVQKRSQSDHPDTKEHHHYCSLCAKRFSRRILRLN